MTNSEKEMAKELYHLMGYEDNFSTWEQRFIERLYLLPYHYHLSGKQQEILQALWNEHIGLPESRRCVYPLVPRSHFKICYPEATQVTASSIKIQELEYKIRELESAIDRLSAGQTVLFRDVESLEATAEVTNERLLQLEAFAEEFE